MLQEICKLKDEIEYLCGENKDFIHEIEQLKKQNDELKRSNKIMKHKIASMSDAKKLLDDNLKTHRAREKIACSHSAILEALYRVNKDYKRLFVDFIPLLEKIQEDVHALSDEFLIPIDSELYPSFLEGKDTRIKAYEERKKALFDYQMAQIERKPSEEIEEARRKLLHLIEESEKVA